MFLHNTVSVKVGQNMMSSLWLVLSGFVSIVSVHLALTTNKRGIYTCLTFK